MSEKFTFFWGGPFFQWHPCKFKAYVNAILTEFNCAEQYMMYRKAIMFNDMETAKAILASSNPKEQKSLGRLVKNFDQDAWHAEARNVVYLGNYNKFKQNSALLKTLLDTGDSTLVEASPVDKIWGIGLHADDPRAKNRKQWRGTNWLGEVLTKVRNDIIQEG